MPAAPPLTFYWIYIFHLNCEWRIHRWRFVAFYIESYTYIRANLGDTFSSHNKGTWQIVCHNVFSIHCEHYGIQCTLIWFCRRYYRKTSNIRRNLVGNTIVDHSDVVGASPVSAAPTTSSFLTWHLVSGDSAKTGTRHYENLLRVGIRCVLY